VASASHAKAAKKLPVSPRKTTEAQNRRQWRWMIAAAGRVPGGDLVLTADFIYTRANSAPPLHGRLRLRQRGAHPDQ